jgi:uncharacterized protein
MALFALHLTYDPARDERMEHRPAHKERMAELAAQGRVLASGPWADDSGALIVWIADSAAEVEELVAADPYLTAPGVDRTLHPWLAGTRHDAVADI